MTVTYHDCKDFDTGSKLSKIHLLHELLHMIIFIISNSNIFAEDKDMDLEMTNQE